MNKAKLREILKKHQLWLNDEAGGIRADLRRANLSGAKLSRANLSGAKLISSVNFIDAHFERVNDGYIAYKTFGGSYPPA